MEIWASKPRDMPPKEVGAYARRAEALGYDGLTVSEGVHDGSLNAWAALAATSRLRVAVSVYVAFARSPMALAYAAWDLQDFSGGRFVVGLGTQVKANIEQRFSAPWTAPVPRMREYVAALRAIFGAWAAQDGSRLRFEGDHYRFTRMQPFFTPAPIEHPRIPIYLGAVGPAMTRLTGEAADGFFTHSCNSDPRTIREIALPALEAGARRAGRAPGDVAVMVSPYMNTGADAAAIAASRDANRRQMAIMYSTPNYWGPLRLRGREELGERLRALTREGRWDELAGCLTDDLVDEIAISGDYPEAAALLRERYGGLPVSLRFPLPADPAFDDRIAQALGLLRS